MTRRLHLVVNPSAGRGRARRRLPAVEAALLAAGGYASVSEQQAHSPEPLPRLLLQQVQNRLRFRLVKR